MWNSFGVCASVIFFIYGTGAIGYAIGKDNGKAAGNAAGFGVLFYFTSFFFLCASYTPRCC